jgi:hypothetical protein
VGCFCDDTVVVADPSDCPDPAQFTCYAAPGTDASVVGYGQYPSDWYAFADCFCDPTLPTLPSQCDCEYCGLRCATGSGCAPGTTAQAAFGMSADAASDQVRYACACLPPPVIIK